MYVSYSPELDIAACGETVEQAKSNLIELIGINIEEMKELGTLDEFLREAGFEPLNSDSTMMGIRRELVGFEPREIPV